MATSVRTFRFPVRSSDVFGFNDPEEERPPEDIAADLDFQDNALEDYLSNILPTASPLGVLGFVSTLADQFGIGTTMTDLSGIAVTVTAAAGRRLRVTGHVTAIQNANAGTPQLYVREGSTSLQHDHQRVDTPGGVTSLTCIAVIAPTAGKHVYKLSAKTDFPTMDLIANSESPAYIVVEDIGSSTI